MIGIKLCSDCRRFLSEDSFYWSNKKKGYRRSYCKRCSATRCYLYSLDNKRDNTMYNKQWHIENKEYHNEQNKQWRINNKEYRAEYKKRWDIDNSNKVYAGNAKRRARKLNQTPSLTNEEKHRVELLYRWAQDLPGNWQVDHVIPLNLGGLHHPDNLQLIPAKQNAQKSNKDPREFYGRFHNFLTCRTR